MLSRIKFRNYKCLDGQEFALGGFNVFCGYNGRGKSSVIQAILMLAQSIDKANSNSLEKLHLNGPLVNLGDIEEIVADLSDTSNWSFDFDLDVTVGSDVHQLTLGYEVGEDFKVGVMNKCVVDTEDYFDRIGALSLSEVQSKARSIKQLPSFINQSLSKQIVHYVSANRRGPVKFEEKRERPDFFSVGTDGSFTINTMASYSDNVDPRMNVDANDNQEYSLEEAITKWLEFIMSGGSVAVQGKNSKKDLAEQKKSSVLSVGFRMRNAKDRLMSAYNVGFGYSYILPIIVSALIAKDGNILIVENPEAHLHPEAQVRMTYLLAKLAARGVQVFVETHSEHVVNGLRLAILKPEFELNHEGVKLYFFDEDYSIKALEIEKDGRINNWPARFFDQYQRELAEILTRGASVR